MIPDLAIGTSLDAQLAPLDEVARVGATGEPSRQDSERAYMLALLAADLLTPGEHGYLLRGCEHYGIDQAAALTIGRAFSAALLRVAQQVGA